MAGAERHLTWLAPRLRERGHHVEIACNTSSRGLDEFRHAMSESGFEISALPIGGKFNARALPSLLQATRRMRIELTHSHLSSASWWCGWLEKMGGPPSVGHVQGFTSAHWHRHQKHLIACSEAVKNHMISQGIRGERIQVLPNPVDAADMEPTRTSSAVRAEMGAADDTPIVGTFAHLSEKKGWRELMQAIPHVLADHPQTQFWCVGDGPLREELEARAEAGGFDASVKFLGFRRDVADVMNAIDVMALPSHREPFGIVYVEAALLNKPVVACNAGGAPDVVSDGVTGRLIPSGDASALAQVLSELLGDRAQAAQMGRAGRERALDLFGWNTFLPQLEAVYEAALAK